MERMIYDEDGRFVADYEAIFRMARQWHVNVPESVLLRIPKKYALRYLETHHTN